MLMDKQFSQKWKIRDKFKRLARQLNAWLALSRFKSFMTMTMAHFISLHATGFNIIVYDGLSSFEQKYDWLKAGNKENEVAAALYDIGQIAKTPFIR